MMMARAAAFLVGLIAGAIFFVVCVAWVAWVILVVMPVELIIWLVSWLGFTIHAGPGGWEIRRGNPPQDDLFD